MQTCGLLCCAKGHGNMQAPTRPCRVLVCRYVWQRMRTACLSHPQPSTALWQRCRCVHLAGLLTAPGVANHVQHGSCRLVAELWL